LSSNRHHQSHRRIVIVRRPINAPQSMAFINHQEVNQWLEYP
jgi:hypothetical protein